MRSYYNSMGHFCKFSQPANEFVAIASLSDLIWSACHNIIIADCLHIWPKLCVLLVFWFNGECIYWTLSPVGSGIGDHVHIQLDMYEI